MACSTTHQQFVTLVTLLLGITLWPGSAWPAPMVNDPRGFHDISWGTPLTSRLDLELSRAGTSISEYQRKNESPTFAGAEMISIRYLTIDDRFARVTIRYKGELVHKQVLNYLESEFGPQDRIPGQMARGLSQQYTWRGPETEINLTYQAGTERGYVFIDSRSLAPRFNDNLTDSAE